MHLMSRNIYISVVTIAKPTDWYTGDRDHDETPRNLKSLLSKTLKLVIMHIKIKVLKVLLITLLSFEDFFLITRKTTIIRTTELKASIWLSRTMCFDIYFDVVFFNIFMSKGPIGEKLPENSIHITYWAMLITGFSDMSIFLKKSQCSFCFHTLE